LSIKTHIDGRKIIENIHVKDDILIGKTILVVDDDVRNLFTLTSVLERHKINVVTAESGHEAIAILQQNPHIELVLNGYYDARNGWLRDHSENKGKRRKNGLLPIIAVTAKAMKGDRQKSPLRRAPADYIVKPVKD